MRVIWSVFTSFNPFFDSKKDSGMILERSFHNEYRERDHLDIYA